VMTTVKSYSPSARRISDALVKRAAADSSVQLIGLDRLYYGL
jgi:hypothetical protein